MRKYTDAPKDIADIIRNGMTVSKEEAFGDGWKKLPVGPAGSRAKAGKGIPASLLRHAATSKKKGVVRSPSSKVKASSIEVNFRGVRLKVQSAPSASYAKGIAKALRDYIKAHPVKA